MTPRDAAGCACAGGLAEARDSRWTVTGCVAGERRCSWHLGLAASHMASDSVRAELALWSAGRCFSECGLAAGSDDRLDRPDSQRGGRSSSTAAVSRPNASRREGQRLIVTWTWRPNGRLRPDRLWHGRTEWHVNSTL